MKKLLILLLTACSLFGQFKFQRSLPDRYTLIYIGNVPAGSTTFKDYSQYSQTIATTGAAIQSVSQFKFGNSSMSFPEASLHADYLTITSPQGLNVGTGDFTIEGWVHATTYPGSGAYTHNLTGPTYTNGYVSFFLQNYSGRGLGINVGQTQLLYCNDVADYSAGNWYYITMMRASGVIYAYSGGVQKGTVSYASAMDFSNMRIGCSQTQTYLQDFRFSNVARYAYGSNGTRYFYPPNKPY